MQRNRQSGEERQSLGDIPDMQKDELQSRRFHSQKGRAAHTEMPIPGDLDRVFQVWKSHS
jgi:hypothetical protein